MKTNISLGVSLISSCLVIYSNTLLANDTDLVATTVPASACVPVSSTDMNRARLSNGAWVFSGSSTGTIRLYCPLPVNAFTLSNSSNDNDITRYRVYYRDSDATGNDAIVRTRLVYRTSSGMFYAGSTWSSNTPNFSSTSLTGNRIDIHPNPHDVRSNALYSFYISIYRRNTSQNPVFSGIDFPVYQVE
ncbi:MAG: hypothetical protein R3F02_15615 [Thiolinea sp.]